MPMPMPMPINEKGLSPCWLLCLPALRWPGRPAPEQTTAGPARHARPVRVHAIARRARVAAVSNTNCICKQGVSNTSAAACARRAGGGGRAERPRPRHDPRRRRADDPRRQRATLAVHSSCTQPAGALQSCCRAWRRGSGRCRGCSTCPRTSRRRRAGGRAPGEALRLRAGRLWARSWPARLLLGAEVAGACAWASPRLRRRRRARRGRTSRRPRAGEAAPAAPCPP